jgi:hypothetical protein
MAEIDGILTELRHRIMGSFESVGRRSGRHRKWTAPRNIAPSSRCAAFLTLSAMAVLSWLEGRR